MTLPLLSQLLGANELYRDDQFGVYCGECSSILSQFPDECIDLTVTSPPYDNLRNYNGYSFPFEDIAKQLFRVTKQGGVVVWIVGDATIKGSETGSSFGQALFFREIGFNLHDTMIYEKGGFANPSSNRYHQVFEYMFVFSKGATHVFNPLKDRENYYKKRGGGNKRKTDGTFAIRAGGQILEPTGMRFNVWHYSIGKSQTTGDVDAYIHPAMFPEQLARDHILSWSNKDSVILDPMCGSGTTLKMALLEGRKAIGIDVSEEYCTLSVTRCLKALAEQEVSK